MTLLEKIQQLCDEKKITFAELERNLDISNGSIRKWSSSSPKSESIVKIASFFNVTTDYLLGLSNIPDPNDDSIVSIQRARTKMSAKEQSRMDKLLRVTFDYAFDDNPEGDDSNS